MPSSLTALANLTLGSAQATVTFSSISGSYRDLVLVINGKASVSYRSVGIRFNGDSGTNYQDVYLTNSGSSANAGTNTGQTKINAGSLGVTSTTNLMTWAIDVMDYSATNKHKMALSRIGTAGDSNIIDLSCGRWASTAAITTLAVFPTSADWASGTTFALYGVAS